MSAPAENSRYFAFISYSHQDKLWADWLHKALETYRVPSRLVGQTTAAGVIPRRLMPIFRDRDELASATDLNRKVNAALTQSANLVVICSPRSAQSRWVNEEVLAFKRLGGSERIFCLIVDGEPNASGMPGREAEECFAAALRYTVGADGQPTRERTEPIAADARTGKDGKTNAKLKLIAGILDVGFDALKQRELQRRNRRLAILSAAAVFVMFVTTTLAIMATIARGDAERRQKQAEELVGFMLGDLNDKLGEVSRLDIMESVDDKAMAYFASLPTKDVTDSALALRVEAFEKIGSVRKDQGHIPTALEAYRAGSAIAEELLRRSPADVKRQGDYANSLTWIGNAYWFQGDLEHAEQNFKVASLKLRAAAEAKPEDSDLAYRLSSALTNAGRVLETRGEFEAAKPYYDDVRKIFEKLSAHEPDKIDWQKELGYAHNNLGKLALEQGQLDVAVTEYRADQSIKIRLAAHDVNNHELQQSVAISNAILGRTLGICGRLEIAKRYMSDAIAGLQTLIVFDSTQVDWRYLFAKYSEQLGGIMRQLGEYDAAEAAGKNSLRELEALVQKDPTNVEWQQELAQSRLESARLALAREDAGAAEKMAKMAKDTLDPLLKGAPENRNLLLLDAQTDIFAGETTAKRGDVNTARERWTRARSVLAKLDASDYDVNVLGVKATCLLLLDDIQSARPVLSKLASIGYRTPDLEALAARKHVAFSEDAGLTQRIAAILDQEPGAGESKQGRGAQEPVQH